MNRTLPLAATTLAVVLGVAASAQQPVVLTPAPAPQPAAADRYYQAIRNNNLAELRALVTQSGPNVADAGGYTPLMLATAFGSVEAMQVLLDGRADVKTSGPGGITALHLAARSARKARLLLDAGADVNASTQIGRTPLMVAVSTTGAIDVARMLIDKGAKIDALDAVGVSPLTAAARVNNADIAMLLLQKGADPNLTGAVPTAFALSAAASHGNLELARTLVVRGANVNASTPDQASGTVKQGRIAFANVTALHSAVIGRNPEVVKLLLESGAAIDPLDIRGMTPLMWAVATDRPNVDTVALLLAKGANPNIRSRADESTLDWARKFNNPPVLAALKLPAQSAPATQPAAAARVLSTPREAVERTMPLLRSASARVMSDGGCVACHAQPMSAIAAELAASRGWQAERNGSDLAQATLSLTSGVIPMLQAREGGGFPDSQLFITWMLATTHAAPSVATDTAVYYLASKQLADGQWAVTGGTRAPIQDGEFFRTAAAIQALQVFGTPALKAEFDQRIARAALWLGRQAPLSTQDRAMQLLGLKWANANPPARATRLRELVALQHADGGWGQTPHLESDAYATGMVLYTLRELGMPLSDRTLQRGTAFLLETQREDGTWYVRNRAMKIQPYFESGFPYGHDQWISQTGTSWAAIALSVATPDTRVQSGATK